MVYETLLLIGALGLGAQFVMGFGHGGHDNHGHGDGHGHNNGHVHDHGGNGHAHSQVGTSAHAAHAHVNHTHSHTNHSHEDHDHTHGRGTGEKASINGFLLNLLSPLNLFSISLGAGATGLLLRNLLPNPLLTGMAAAIGGIAFMMLVVQPIKKLVFSFASKPAGTLSSMVAQEVEVLSRFDERGRGMVRAEVDGELVRVLAHLETDDLKQGTTITPGERLVVTQVDTEKNTLRVTRL